MAAKKKGLAKYRAKKVAAKKKAQSNPPMLDDLGSQIIPAFGAYAATKLVSRITHTLVQKRWPKAGKYAAAGSAVLSFLGAWTLAHRIEKLAPHHDAIVVGSGIAAAGTIFKALPVIGDKYGWILSEPKTEALAPKTEAAAQAPLPDLGIGDEGDGLGADDLSDIEGDLGSLGGAWDN